MKLLIGDSKKILNYRLPEISEKFFMINFSYYFKTTIYREVLTLKAVNSNWVIYGDDKLLLKKNGASCENIIINENMSFELKFADMPDYIPIFILSDQCDYEFYNIYNVDNIKVGSDSSCQISCQSLSNKVFEIYKSGLDYMIKHLDENEKSVYLNSNSFIESPLNTGDYIFCNGIKIIFMHDFLMINKFNFNLIFKELVKMSPKNNLIDTPITPVTDIEKSTKLYDENEVFVHTPRFKNEIKNEYVKFDEPPAKEITQKIPAIFTTGSSAIMGITSSLTLLTSFNSYKNGNSDTVSFFTEVAICGLMLISSFFIPFLTEKWEKGNEKKREKKRQEKYREYVNEKNTDIENIVSNQEMVLKNNNTDLSQILENIKNKSSDLWNREIIDSDFLTITIGEGNIKPRLEIEAPTESFALDEDDLKKLVLEVSSKKRILKDVPIVHSLIENKVTPIVINNNFKDDYVKSIIIQLLYYYSGNDLKIVTITNEYNSYKWDFLKYMPHSWNKDYDKRYFASNEEELLQVSIMLEQEYNNRKKELKGTNEKSSSGNIYKNFSEYFLIVTDDYKMAREMSIVNKIIDESDNLGFSLLVFEDSIKNLPSRSEILIEINNDEGHIVEKSAMNKEQMSFKPKYINNFSIEKYAKIIANIPVGIKSSEMGIPNSLTFLDMYHAGRVDQLNIFSRWQNNNPVTSLKAPIGIKENDKMVELDLHEKYHGPHGLIAGSTGSGKSEFIITYILSLAVNYHPYEVQFVLIDYKGGGLAGAFENRETGIKIPHLVGTITNLDKSEMGRTLVSIKSELQRRQRVFNETREALDESTIDIYKYQRLYREGKVKEPMSHLFIISDEFAELKAQQPDFMDELVSAARIGRSLGIHLILATQKPSGVVDEQIWSNTRFRVCLKVQTTEDSNELLKKPDAAYIKGAGRFYLQVGNDEIYELGQSGWCGAKYVPSDNVHKKVDDDILFISNCGETLKSVNEEVKKDNVNDMGEQLGNIVKYIYNLALSKNLKFSSLWLDNVPSTLYFNDLSKKYAIKNEKYLINPVIGEYDDPANQKQGYVDLPLIDCGNTFITGASGSGKTTLLSTIIYETIIIHSSEEVNFYILDFAAEKLKIFQKAPQVGDVLTSADTDKIKFLFYMLEAEKDKRFAYYSTNGGDYIKDAHSNNAKFPHIIVVINEFEVFKELFEDIFDYEFVPFTRNCNKVGITFIVTSTAINSLGYMAESNFPKKIVLNMVDTSEYTTFFNEAPLIKKNSGRGLIELDNVYEFQIALAFEESLYDSKINYVINQLNKYLSNKASRVPTIPDNVTIDMLKGKVETISEIPLGINIKTAQLNTFDFSNKLNIIASNSYTPSKKFFPKLFEILENLNDTKIIVLNSIKGLKISHDETIKYYDSGFKDIINVLNKNVIKYIEQQKEDKFIIIFLGYAQLQRYLLKEKEENEEINTIDDLINNSIGVDNFNFIVYDDETLLAKIEDSEIDQLFKRNTGIWLGKEYDSQNIFEVNDQNSDMEQLNNNNVTIIKNGKVSHLKFN